MISGQLAGAGVSVSAEALPQASEIFRGRVEPEKASTDLSLPEALTNSS